MGDAGAELGSDRDYRKETQSDDFGRSCLDHNLVPGVYFFGSMANVTIPRYPKNFKSGCQTRADSMTVSGQSC